jgi:hypothetical protein
MWRATEVEQRSSTNDQFRSNSNLLEIGSENEETGHFVDG